MVMSYGNKCNNISWNKRSFPIHPYAQMIYTFKNGDGMRCQYISFTQTQLDKGMKYVLELISRLYNVKGSKLVTMDGIQVHKVSDLMSRGAYVLILFGQSKFREIWYFLPDHAIDTGENTEVWSRTS